MSTWAGSAWYFAHGSGGGGIRGGIKFATAAQRKGSLLVAAESPRKASVLPLPHSCAMRLPGILRGSTIAKAAFAVGQLPNGGGGGCEDDEAEGGKTKGGDSMRSDVDEEAAAGLLVRTQECSPLFRSFTQTEVSVLARTLPVVRFQAADTILHEGEVATFFAVVLDGQVSRDGQALDRHLDRHRGQHQHVRPLPLPVLAPELVLPSRGASRVLCTGCACGPPEAAHGPRTRRGQYGGRTRTLSRRRAAGVRQTGQP